MTDYPDCCLRGISKIDYIIQDGRVTSKAFIPDERTAEGRIDNCIETSINWEDDDQALPITLKSYQNGVVRLNRSEIDHINSLPNINNEIGYERSPEENNPYHGNILFRKDIPNALRTMIAGSLALASSKIIQKK